MNKDICLAVLKKKLGHSDFSFVSFDVSPIKEFLGVFGEYAELILNVKLSSEFSKVSSFKFFVKSAFQEVKKTEAFRTAHDVFKKEYLFYTQVQEDLERYACKRITAQCYWTSLYQFTLMDDLTESGFERTRQPFEDFNHAIVAFQVLANFHAASLLMNRDRPFSDSTYKDLLEEVVFVNVDSANEGLFYSLCKKLRVAARELLQDYDDDVIDRTLSIAQKRITELLQPSTQFVNTLTHGDAQIRNIMFKYDDTGKPIDGMLVDFQLVRFNPPALDLMYFLATAYSVKFRSVHRESLLDVYYRTLTDCLKIRNVEVNDIFPEDQFRQSCVYYEEYARLLDAFAFNLKLPVEMRGSLILNKELFYDSIMRGNCDVNLEALRKFDGYREALTDSLETLIKLYV